MNTYYLKKFRKWAKDFVKIYANEVCRNRYDVKAGVAKEVKALTYEEAKETLVKERRYFILYWCAKRKRAKLNKQLAKL